MSKPDAVCPPARDTSWACETLPMAVRRELLEHELRKLGFRKKATGPQAQPGAGHTPSTGDHPQAAGSPPEAHGGD